MISGIDIKQTINYQLKDDMDNPTIWKLGIIPSTAMGGIMQDLANISSGQIEISFSIVRMGLKGWENYNREFKTVKEKFHGWERDLVSTELIDEIPIKVIFELSGKILEINKLTEQEAKN